MRVLVTGSSGFVGRWVMEGLARDGIDPIGLDISPPIRPHPSYPFIECSILDQEGLSRAFEEARPDALIHLAARTDLDEKKDLAGYDVNIGGVRNVLAAARASKIRRAIFTSTQLVCRVGHVPSGECDYCPDTLYGQSKVVSEGLVRKASGEIPEWCIVRPTTVWGPGMSTHYQMMLRLIAQGRYFHCGSGALRKSYVYSENIANQYSALIKAPSALIHRRMFYLADHEPMSLRFYADELARAMGAPRIRTMPLSLARIIAKIGDLGLRFGIRNVPFTSFRLRNILTEYIFDTSPIVSICGNGPVTELEGIRRTARWFLDLHPEFRPTDSEHQRT